MPEPSDGEGDGEASGVDSGVDSGAGASGVLVALGVGVGVGEGDASVLAFFLVELGDELALVPDVVVFFAVVELEDEAALVSDFFGVEVVPVLEVFLAVLLAVFVLVDVSLCAQETMNPAATVRAMNGSKNFFIGVFDQTVQTPPKSQAYS